MNSGIRRFLFGLAVIGDLALSPLVSAAEIRNGELDLSCPRCSVIFLNIELLRADFVGAINGTGLTPNIDSYFQNGIIFEDASAPAGETFLSNTAVLTGIKPHQIRFRPSKIDNYDQLEPEVQREIRSALVSRKSAAQILAENGYDTISVNQGGRAGKQAFLDRGFTEYSQWSSKLLFEDMIDILIEKTKATDRRPAFVLFRPTLLHNHQYRRPKDMKTRRLPSARYITYQYQAPDGATEEAYHLKRKRGLDLEASRRLERAIYTQQLAYADDQLDRIFEVLTELYGEQSIVVLYANHGSGLGDHGNFEHGTSYQSDVHVPLLIKHPGVSSTIRVTDPVALIDLVPAIFRMLGIRRGTTAHDAALYDTMLGRSTRHRTLVGRNGWDEYIRIGRWKLLIAYGRFKSLFDLEADPLELVDLYTMRPMVAKQLESELLQRKLNAHGNTAGTPSR